MIDWSQMIAAESRAAEARRERVETELTAALAQLAETDWMVIREAEEGVPLPEDTRAARKAARGVASAARAALGGQG